MAMIKVMRAADQPGLLHGEPASALIKVAGRGLRGDDLRDLVKRAGHRVADAIKKLDFGPGDVPAHSIALGATEFYGANRNGDGFKEAACRQYHKTFEKYARCYRDHQNKDPSKSYGVIKLALYNEPMHRIELIKAYNGTKEAAERNGGLVAGEELAALEKDGDFDSSMACRVPFDVCSCCGNRARNRAEYCTSEKEGGHCKGGGLKSNIASVLADGTQVYADNPDPLWFDNSKVWRHADRIAMVNAVPAHLVKAAAAGGGTRGGAALAEAWGVTMPLEVALAGADEVVKLAGALAGWEVRYRSYPPRDSLGLAFIKQAGTGSWSDHGTRVNDALAALAALRIVAPLEGFLELVGGVKAAAVAAEVRRRLPGIYSRMLADGSLEKAAADGSFLTQHMPSLQARRWAQKRAVFGSLDHGDVMRRVTLASLYREVPPPLAPEPAGAGGHAEKLARTYALYKLAVLHSQPRDGDFDWACMATARSNYY